MNFRRISRALVAGTALSLSAATLFLVACASQPVEIGPTVQPGGWQTPHIKPVIPPGPGVDRLPDGFKPCGDYVAQVKLDDGTTVNVRICIYCSSNPNDRTVYVQQDCAGNYRPGQRNPGSGRPTSPPPSKPLSNLGGSLSEKDSTITFTVDEEFEINTEMLKGTTAEMSVGGVDMKTLMEMGVDYMPFPAGTEVKISGPNEGVADVAFWNFGAGHLRAVGDDGSEVTFDVIPTESVGALVIVRVNGEQKIGAGGPLPWRGE